MRKILLIGLLLILSVKGICETFEFTVMAISGLNMREGPDLKSKIITTLSFGTIVQVDGSYEEFEKKESEGTLEIEGTKGYWLKVQYNSIQGYVFSAFTLMGKWVEQPSEYLNTKYRILREGYYCDPINYSPQLHWYALIIKGDTTVLKKVNVILRLQHEYTNKEKKEFEFWKNAPIKIETDLEEKATLLLGTESELIIENQIFPRILNMNQFKFNPNEGMFFYPEQFITLYQKPYEYNIGAKERITLDSTEQFGYKKEYRFLYRFRNNLKNIIYEFDLSEDLHIYGTGELHSLWQTPRLMWVGDFNEDEMLDLILYSHTMNDSCGGCGYTHLFVSDNSQKNQIRKVAGDSYCGCLP